MCVVLAPAPSPSGSSSERPTGAVRHRSSIRPQGSARLRVGARATHGSAGRLLRSQTDSNLGPVRGTAHDCFRTKAATRTPSAPDTPARTNAGVDPVVISDVLIAKGAHLHRVDREARCRVASAVLLSRDDGCRCLQDACKQRRMLSGECDGPGAGTGASAWPHDCDSRVDRLAVTAGESPNCALRTHGGCPQTTGSSLGHAFPRTTCES